MNLAAMSLAVVLSATPQVAKVPAGESIRYLVRSGDTLEALSRNYLVTGRNWRDLAKLTGVLTPRLLPVGKAIAIPRSWLRYRDEPARLASFRGTVAIRSAGRSIPNAVGTSIREGTQIDTGANSFVTLMLADNSKIVIPSQSRVHVRQLRRLLLTGAIDYRIEVEAGRIETKVAPIGDPTGRYRIDTPVSMTAVRGTEFRVVYDHARRVGAAEVLEGNVAVSSNLGGIEKVVKAGFGAAIEHQGQTRVAALLAAPSLVEPGRPQSNDEVRFRVAPLPGALRYRVVIAADAGFVENLSEQVTETGTFAIAEIPNGNLFARVSAIGADGLEGLAQSYSFRRLLAGIEATVGRVDGGYRFRWSGQGTGKRRYRFQLMRGSQDSLAIVDEVALTQEMLVLHNLPADVYYWRVGVTQSENGEEIDNWTDFEKLTIAPRDS